jgi:hypothetical protein
MTIAAVAQLMGLAIALTIFDSLLLLYVNEGILTTKDDSGWRIAFGSEAAGIRGKGLFFPNPFMLHKPLFRLSWHFEKANQKTREDWDSRRVTFSMLAPILYGLGITLFVLLPLVLFFAPADAVMLTTFALLYLQILASLVWVYLNRTVLGLDNKKIVSLCFECLVCPPITLNLIRRLSLQTPAHQDLVYAASYLLTPADWEAAKIKFLAQLDHQISGEDQNSDRFKLLHIRRNEIAAIERSA